MEGIIQLLKDLNHHKARGPDRISACILKEMADQLAPALVLASLSQGILQDD